MTQDSRQDVAVTAASKTQDLLRRVANGEISAQSAKALLSRPASIADRQHDEGTGAIAVIGMAGRFPGADGLEAFWTMLAEAHSEVRPGPQGRWGEARYAGGWLEDISSFDHGFFGISRREAEVMDPQQLLFLEMAWSALENAAYAERDLSGRKVGVFVGAGAGDFARHLMEHGAEPDGLSFMGNSNAILAGRIAYLLNLRGPCLTIDTACSSSLTAVHLACEALNNGTADMAIAGGVCVLPTPTFVQAATRAGMLSRSGQCRPFDADADGFVPGEAAGALVLKPLARAIADGDFIWGVIEGSGINQDGRTNGITAPSAVAQADLLQQVYRHARVSPSSISYVEAHGTGTRLGDPIEIEALTRVFRQNTRETGYCAIGSVKASVGHTMSAAGVVSLIKVLLAMKHRAIPASLNMAQPNPACELAASPFVVNPEMRPWEPREGVRRAGVSGFGFSGSNAHIVLREAPGADSPASPADEPRLFLLSARSRRALAAAARRLAQHVALQAKALDLDALSWSLAAGRSHHGERAAIIASSADDLTMALSRVAATGSLETPAGTSQLHALARLYLDGRSVDPEELVRPGARRRAALPPYPFERVFCGLRPATRKRLQQGLHPLVDRYLADGSLTTSIAPSEPFLADHVVQGSPILPGACIAALALAAGKLGAPGITGLSELHFMSPAGAAEAADLRLELKSTGFALGTSAKPDRILARGSFLTDAPGPQLQANLPGLKAALPREIAGDALAAKFMEAGVALGPLFRGVRKLWLSADGESREALAELGLPGEELAGLAAYDLHPTFLDALFQAAMASWATSHTNTHQILVPARLRGLVIHERPEASCYGHVSLMPDAGASQGARFRARILDDTGRVLVDIAEFVALPLAQAAAPHAVINTPRPSPVPFYEPRWQLADVAQDAMAPADGVVLILRHAEDGRLGDAMAQALGDRDVLQCVIGSETRPLSIGAYEIDGRDRAGFERFLSQLKPLRAVYLLAPATADADWTDLPADATTSLLASLTVLQPLMKRGGTFPITVLTMNAHALPGDSAPGLRSAMLGGLALSAARELPHVRLSILDLSAADVAADPRSMAQQVLAFGQNEPARTLALRKGQIWERSLDPAKPASDQGGVVFRNGGAYVIIGGAGGLGLALAAHLARTCQARLLLVGRSPLSASQSRAIAALNELGGTALYVSADAADRQQIEAAIAQGRDRFGRFDGAIQAAMVLNDMSFAKLDETALTAVLRPKIDATCHLVRALMPDKPDMVLLFSSANAFIGNPGQANYAAAAAGQDAIGLAMRNAGLPVSVINWGFWGEVGAVTAPVFQERAQSLGIGALTVAEGMAALENFLREGRMQTMIMKVSHETLCRLGVSFSPPEEPDAKAATLALADQFGRLERAAHDRLVALFQSAGFMTGHGQAAAADELRRKLGVIDSHHRLFDAVLDILVRAGLLEERDGRFTVTGQLLADGRAERLQDLDRAEDSLVAAAPWLKPFMAITRRCLESYGKVLSGKVSALELLFPGGSSELVAPLYKGNPIADHCNGLVVAAISDMARHKRPLTIAEVGAGTGGTAIAIMQALTDAGLDFRYLFTDVSATLVRQAKAQLRARFPQTEFAVLDLEKPVDPARNQAFDVVVAANVLHATQDIASTVAHCQGLLREGGTLVLNEAVLRRDFSTLIFGLTDGWWRFKDADRRLPHSPLLDEARWRALLASGFGDITNLSDTGDGTEVAQAVFVAKRRSEAMVQPPPPSGGIESTIRRCLAEALHEPVDRISLRDSFASMGVDSIVGVDLALRLTQRLGYTVPVTALFDHPSPAQLGAFLRAEHGERVAAAGTPPLPAQPGKRNTSGLEIAVVGMAGQWPGAADLAAYWNNLAASRASITYPPEGRWPGFERHQETWSKGGYLKHVDAFDPLFFEMSGVEADHTDPQARLFLMTAWRALENAAYSPAFLDGRRCGVFVGVAAGDYPSGAAAGELPPPHAFMGNAQSVLAGRLAYLLNLKGPALAIDTACSSSLVALHLACNSIASGESDIALAGGVFVTSTPAFHQLTGGLGMTSPTGATRAFDDGADGFVPAEGVGVMVLRPLQAALADGDNILGVIRATGSNQDGRTHGMTAPSARAQAELLGEVWARAGIRPGDLDYIEAHGTGTKLGDPIEVEALARALGSAAEGERPNCLIGSVKSNIGHAGPAAGAAGVQKVLLALGAEQLPASLNFERPNRHIDFTNLPVSVARMLSPWPHRSDRVRMAGVSAFGLSGTNAHVVIEEAPRRHERNVAPPGPYLFPLSGRTWEALAARTADLARWMEHEGQAQALADIAYSLGAGRRHWPIRHMIVASTHAELLAGLHSLLSDGRQPAITAPAIAAAYMTGEDVNWLEHHRGAGLRRVPLPTYPFTGERHWVKTPTVAHKPIAVLHHETPQERLYAPRWRAEPLPAADGMTPAVALIEDGTTISSLLSVQCRLRQFGFTAANGLESVEGPVIIAPNPALSPLALAQTLTEIAQHLTARRVLILARGSGASCEAIVAAVALAPALGRPGWSVLRLGDAKPDDAMARAILAEVASNHEPVEAEWRDGRRRVRRMQLVDPQSTSWSLPKGSVCWVVGGTGAIGKALASHLRARHGAKVITSARHAGPAVMPLDVTDATAVMQAAADIRLLHGRIDAVFHLAGKMRSQPLSVAAQADITAVLGPKILGAINLDRATEQDPLSAFVVFSSLAGELGDFGQGDYAVANRFLSGFAAWRDLQVMAGTRQGRTLSIGWPVWHSGSMAAAGPERDAALRASGLAAIADEAALRSLDQLLAGQDSIVNVIPAGGRDPFAAPPARSLQASPAGELLPAVIDLLAQQLQVKAREIAADAPFGVLGLDSLHMRSFADAVSRHFNVDVAATDLFRHNTPQLLAAQLRDLGAEAAASIMSAAPLNQIAVPRLSHAEPIAVIGMAARLPGAADVSSFWQLLLEGRDAIGEVPADRWDWRTQTLSAARDGETLAPRWGGFIEGVDRFDPAFFGLSPREAAFLDPQARLLLETAWHGLEDAGLAPSSLAGRSVGVFVGSQLNDYAQIMSATGEAVAQAVLGNTKTLLANRLSFLLDLRGPSETIDTACSSSLIGVHRAVQAIRNGSCEMAVAGGVHLMLSPQPQVMGAELGMLSPSGRCMTFDAAANGYVRGEGVGIVVLKPLARALADGDSIRAVIRESGENHGGRASSLTAPNPAAQSELIAGVLRRAGVPVSSIGHVEAHGTGTSLGDPIEVDALSKAFAAVAAERGEAMPPGQFCALSAVKSNIGHLEPASGIAGLIKSVLCLENGQLVPSLHLASPNPLLRLDTTPFRLQRSAAPFPKPADGPRRAAVSSFGLGGSNAHVLLEEWPRQDRSPPAATGMLAVPLSARDSDALHRQVGALAIWVGQQLSDPWMWPDLVATLQRGREAMACRMVILAASADELLAKLKAWQTGDRTQVMEGAASNGLAALFDKEEAAALLADAIAQGRPERLAKFWAAGMAVDWNKLPIPPGSRRRSLPGYVFAPERHWFDQRGAMPAAVAAPVVPPPPRTVAGPPASPPAAAAPPAREQILQIFADALYLDAATLDIDANLTELGVDSILAVEIARKLQQTFDITLPATRLYDASTIRSLCALVEQAGGSAAPTAAPPPVESVKPAHVALLHSGAVLERLTSLLADLLYLPADNIDPDQPFVEMGLDSILAVELARKTESEFGVSLRATRLYERPTPRGLAELISGDLATEPAAPTAPVTATVAPAPESDLAHRIRAVIARELALPPEDIDLSFGPLDLGLDRVVARRLVAELAASTGQEIDEASLFRAESLDRFIQSIESAPPARDRGGPTYSAGAVAVIGMSGRFPGADDLDSFWSNLERGVDSVGPVPASRFAIDPWYDPDPAVPNRTYCRDGGFLTGVEDFDPRFFGITPAEARIMDPQQRLFLETSRLALEDAGLPDHELDGASCAVFVGCSQGDYAQRAAKRMSAQFGMGNVGSVLAARIAYHLNLRGPAVAIDTACSSSLVAVHLACQSLRAGESELALAGGVALMTTPSMHLLTSHARMLSPDGRCKTFDASANGFVPAEGVGAVVLKLLDKALADGDRIIGVIEASGTNQDGRSNGLTAPSLAAQRELELAVWRRFDIAPESIGHVEAHGTGTSLGDPIEVQALADAFSTFTRRTGFCALSSVKSNIGHAVPAAGIAGLIKTLLLLHHRRFVPSLHLTTANPQIDFARSPFFVPQASLPWPSPESGAPRRGAVNSFGFSGTNAHLIVAEALEAPKPARASEGPVLLLLSARTPAALMRSVARLADWIESRPGCELADVAYTLAVCRSQFRQRFPVIAASAAEAVAALRAFHANAASPAPGGTEVSALVRALSAARNPAERRSCLEALAQAFRAGARITGLYARGERTMLPLPITFFERQRLWVEDTELQEPRPAKWRIGADDPVLSGHMVAGKSLLPGAASLLMLLDAAGTSEVSAFRWLRPVEAGADGVHLTYDAERMQLLQDAKPVAQAQQSQDKPWPGVPSLADALSRCVAELPAADLYRRLERLGVRYGETFRCIRRLRHSPEGDIGYAELRVPGVDKPSAFVLDAALHALAGLSDAAEGLEGLPLPAQLARIRRHGDLATAQHAVLRRTGETFDLVILTSNGEVLLEIEGYGAKASAQASQPLSFYQGQWSPALGGSRPPRRPDVIMTGAGAESLASALAKLPGDGTPTVIDLGRSAHLPPLARDAHVVVVSGTATTNDDILTVHTHLQALCRSQTPLRLTIVTVESCDHGPATNWRAAALAGLGKVMMREAAYLDIAIVDVASAALAVDPISLARRLMAEEPQHPARDSAPDDICLTAGQRLVRSFTPVTVGTANRTPYRNGGVYVIIGGMGGLGAALARRLSAQHHATIVLSGRSPKGAVQEEFCAELATLGGEAQYIAADCTRPADLQRVRMAALAHTGGIDGIFHAAFVMEDAAFTQLSEAQLRAALGPKLDGTEAIIETFADLEPDFIALFSSTNSMTANPGQANYVAASMGQDAAAHHFAGKVRLINWGFWQETGRVSGEQYVKTLKRHGIGGISNSEGLDALAAILAQGLRQVSVLKHAAPQLTPPVPVAVAMEAAPDPAKRKDIAETVRRILVKELMLEASDLSDAASFAEIGIDSISMVDIHGQLEALLGPVPRSIFMEAATVGELITCLAAAQPGPIEPPDAAMLRLVRADGQGTASFWVPSFVGESGWVSELAEASAGQWPVYCLQPTQLLAQGMSIHDISDRIASEIAAKVGTGAVVLGGYSYGGILALEIGSRLAERGTGVEQVILLDSFAPQSEALESLLSPDTAPELTASVASVLLKGWRARRGLTTTAEPRSLRDTATEMKAICEDAPPVEEIETLLSVNLAAIHQMRQALRAHEPSAGLRKLKVCLIRATRRPESSPVLAVSGEALANFKADGAMDHGWSRWLDSGPEIVPVDKDHFGLGERDVMALVAHRLGGVAAPDPLAHAIDVLRRHTCDVLEGVAPEAVTPDISLRELGANSIDRVEIATLAMREMKADIPRPRLATVGNIGALAALLTEFAARQA